MILNGADFGPIWGMSGVMGFYEWREYWIHCVYRIMFPGLFTFKGMTFVAKTVTLKKNAGNMQLKEDGVTPQEFVPRCVYADFRRACMLNCVGLSNFGLGFYLDQNKWQQRTDPLVLSFMCLEKEEEKRMKERNMIFGMLKRNQTAFKCRIALQENVSCPNVGHEQAKLLAGVRQGASLAKQLGFEYILKFNSLLPPVCAAESAKLPGVSAIHISNTIPWLERPDVIDWIGLFKGQVSPLKERGFGVGGFSGPQAFPLTLEWVREYDRLKPAKPLIAGGGIIRAADVWELAAFNCVKAVAIGTVTKVRPWRMRSIIRAAYQALRPSLDSD